eukprot:CAMPEP_0113918260 /NCGR_PEP_ID=MMETSP0780_2-20120614/33239_1 /TAXON_ID=652834 /ORGANISM="Palpitomonas bilix" /LENGTH=43 /DNA_ID=CAMNT_0000918021 /DNA_START=1044 /DNA_END=1172 /DNA_ORIENTATION=- /assembly_acc=CAM_ASM_000599
MIFYDQGTETKCFGSVIDGNIPRVRLIPVPWKTCDGSFPSDLD